MHLSKNKTNVTSCSVKHATRYTHYQLIALVDTSFSRSHSIVPDFLNVATNFKNYFFPRSFFTRLFIQLTSSLIFQIRN